MDQTHSEHTQARSTTSGANTASKGLIIAVLLIIIGGGGFVGGVQYEKGHVKTSSTTTRTGAFPGGTSGFGGRGGGMQDGGIGTVTAVNATSISLENQRTSTTNTYAITSATTITNDGTTTTASAIAVGDSVLVMTGSATSTTATSIQVNPTMGAGGPSGQTTQSSTTTN